MCCFSGRRGRLACLGLILLLWLCGASSAVAAPGNADPVDQAIARAKTYLYSQQQDGIWERASVQPGASQPGALTALSTYALLANGDRSSDERLKSAMAFLLTADLRGVDALGLRCQVWALLSPEPALRIAAGRDAARLEHALNSRNDPHTFCDYYDPSADSLGQYGLVGLWACGRTGISIPPRYWQQIEEPLRPDLRPASICPCIWQPNAPINPGSVAPSPAPSFATTEAGVAALLMTRDFLHASNGLDCRGNVEDAQLDAGLRWLNDHASEALDSSSPSHLDNAALWTLARIGNATGRRCFGEIDWYQRGAAELLRRQDARDGSWGNVADTAFALLFLAQGRAPVAIAKLDYGITPHDASPKPGNWNQRPLDVANAAAWIARQSGRSLNWRVARLGEIDDTGHDLLGSGPGEAPVLYLSGNQTLEFTDAELERLRNYALGGGLILGHADGSSSMFAESFRALGAKLFPYYVFRELPPEHPIFAQGPFSASAWRHKPAVEGLSNGCRELMVLLPSGDPSRFWQTQWVARGMIGSDVGRTEDADELAADIVAYTGDLSSLPQRRLVCAGSTSSKSKPVYSLSVARLQYDGNWDPEPAGWSRLAAKLRCQEQVNLCVEPVELGEGKLPGYRVAHLTGTGRFRLSELARKELRKFAEQGGILIVEAAGGSTEFTTSAEAELEYIYGDKAAITPLGIEHAVYSTGQRIDGVDYRPAARRLLGDLHTPRVRGLDAGGRTIVFLSAEDLSAGLTGVGADSIVGYDPASAASLMGNMLLYAANK